MIPTPFFTTTATSHLQPPKRKTTCKLHQCSNLMLHSHHVQQSQASIHSRRDVIPAASNQQTPDALPHFDLNPDQYPWESLTIHRSGIRSIRPYKQSSVPVTPTLNYSNAATLSMQETKGKNGTKLSLSLHGCASGETHNLVSEVVFRREVVVVDDLY